MGDVVDIKLPDGTIKRLERLKAGKNQVTWEGLEFSLLYPAQGKTDRFLITEYAVNEAPNLVEESEPVREVSAGRP